MGSGPFLSWRRDRSRVSRRKRALNRKCNSACHRTPGWNVTSLRAVGSTQPEAGHVAKTNAALPPDFSPVRIDDPWPILCFGAQTRRYRILPNIIHLCRQLLASFIVAQAMIEISLLPHDTILCCVKTFRITGHLAHRLVAWEA